MDIYKMTHRWCNCDFGKNGGYKSSHSHVSCNTSCFYSYSTVYAKWLDKTPGNKLMVIMDSGCSTTSRKHLAAIRQAIPDDVKYIETHISSYYSYNNVDFSDYHWQTQIPIVLLNIVKDLVESFKDSKSVSTYQCINIIKSKIDDINWLLENRKDCKVKDINESIEKNTKLKKIFSLVRKKCAVEEMIDNFLGTGTFATYESRLTSQKKAEKTRNFVAWFNKTHYAPKPYTKKEIKAMPISKKVMLACFPKSEQWEINNDLWHEQRDRYSRLAKYLLGNKAHFNGHRAESNVINNRFTGTTYKLFKIYDDGYYWQLNNDCKSFVRHIMYSKGHITPSINLAEYKKLQNKDQWLKRFYQKCEIVSRRCEEVKVWMKMQTCTDDELNQCTEEDIAKHNRIQLQFAAYMADQEAQRIAKEEEQKRMEEEKIRLKAERDLKYNSYVARGIEGYRALYYEKLDGISVSRSFGDEFFFGGNVLLRWRTEELIETSKNILITIPQAKNIFEKVSNWHNNPNKFESCKLQTKSGDYNAQSYKNDILTAGCHKVAYCEMERMYNEILKREAV